MTMPMHVAAEYWLRMTKFAGMYGSPDETGMLEGQFCCPVPDVLHLMGEMVQNEFKTLYAYKTYSNSLRDLSHHSIAEEFESHGTDELDHADWLMRRMSVLGGALNLPDIPAPPASTDPVDIIKTMIRLEQEGIANWRRLKDMVGEDNPMYIKIEEYMATEQEHLDELWQLLPHEARSGVLAEANMDVMAAKLGYRRDYGGPYDSYDPRVGDEATRKGEVKRLLGYINRTGRDRKEVEREYIADQKSQGMWGGGLAGALLGGALGARATMHSEPLTGALIGAGVGGLGLGALGRYVGGNEADHVIDASYYKKASREMPFERASRGQAFVFGPDSMGTYEGARRQQDMLRAGNFGGGDYFPTSIGPAMSLKQASADTPLMARLRKVAHGKYADNSMQLLEVEAQGLQAEEANEKAYLQQRAQSAETQLQQMQQQMQQAMEAQQQMQQETAAKDQQLQATQQAMQAASNASTQAMMQAVNSQKESIQSKQTASQTLMAQEELKQKLRELIDPSPPPPPAQMGQQGVPVEPTANTAGSMEAPVQSGAPNEAAPAGAVGAMEQPPQPPPQEQPAPGEPPKTASLIGKALMNGRAMARLRHG